MSSIFANGSGDWDSIPGRVLPKTQKIVLDAAFLSTQHYKVKIKGKVEIQGKELRPPLHFGVVAVKHANYLPWYSVEETTLFNDWK